MNNEPYRSIKDFLICNSLVLFLDHQKKKIMYWYSLTAPQNYSLQAIFYLPKPQNYRKLSEHEQLRHGVVPAWQ